jgi:uncharacterized 2Fe-2S/4Fe-4S cluster protein (DUF4445 family)
MIELLLVKHKVVLQKLAIVGNTAMHHIFSGFDVSPLAQYPFDTPHLHATTFTTSELDWNFEVVGDITFFPSIGSFVGSDILAGIAATGMHKNDAYCALIDLGTNGEIVVGNKNQLICASTAAGPAFEGTNISMGMRATTGAISSIKIVDNQIKVNVIGNTAPKGICGSALVDAVAIFRELDLIGMFGEINSGENFLSLAGHVGLTQKDINEFQLAKAAIAAGLEILCKKLKIQLSDIQEVYIAGGFGNYINTQHLIQTGMIEVQEEQIRKMGNTALIGAKMFLFLENAITQEILSKTQHVNLESDAAFQDIYVDKMLFN